MTTTTDTTDRDAAIVAKWEEDLRSGAVFARAAMGERSRFGYQPPANPRRYGAILEALGRLAAEGDRSAFVASTLVSKVNLFGTVGQQNAALWDGLFEATSKDWDDVIGRTGPEASRPSAHRHAWTTRSLLHYYVAVQQITEPERGLGWVAARLCEREGLNVR